MSGSALPMCLIPRWIQLAGLLGAGLILGCGSPPADQPELGEVAGIVLLDGQPLPMAELLFQPDEGRPSTGQTDDAGRFVLRYNAQTTGAKLGHHSVRITTRRNNVDPRDPTSPEYPEKLPPRYHSQSELTADIKPGKNELKFELNSKPSSQDESRFTPK